jgi:hypothetical protein
MPRAFLHAMPDEWQGKMAALLEEWDATWEWGDDIDGSRVQVIKNGRLTKMPDYLREYRHPDRSVINSMRRPPCPDCGGIPCIPNCGLEPTYDNRII